MADLVTSTCIGCGASDDHPKHVLVIDDTHNSVAWHMDCHTRAAVPCEVCAHQIADAAGVTGSALRDHLVALPAPAVTVDATPTGA
jgi:hypothetical protein